MGLPVKALPTATVEVEGQAIEVRGISRSEALQLNKFTEATADEAEIYLLTVGANVPESEAKQWYETTDPFTVGLLLDKIMELSGLTGNGPNPK